VGRAHHPAQARPLQPRPQLGARSDLDPLALGARTGDDHELGEVEDRGPSAPGREAGERVGADDQHQLGRRLAAGEVLQRVDGVGGAIESQLEARDFDPGLVEQRQLGHGVARQRRGELALELVRRDGGRQDDHPLDAGRGPRRPRDLEVAAVERVEAAAEQPEPHAAGSRRRASSPTSGSMPTWLAALISK
jgi:hypothetical protein